MPLTDKPFSRIPEIEELGNDLEMNVSDRERAVTGLAGLVLLTDAASRPGLQWTQMLIGGAALWRAFTGRCGIYRTLGIDTRHPQASPAERNSRIPGSQEPDVKTMK